MKKIWIIFFLVCNAGTQLASAVHLHSPEDVMVEKVSPHAACGVTKKEQEVNGCPSDGLGIINGMEAKRNAWPWQVNFEILHPNKKPGLCGGSLINKNWVVTAAHCEVSTSSRLFLGLHDLNDKKQPGEKKKNKDVQEIKICAVFNHPKYTKTDNEQDPYDITLILLKSPALINKHVSPVCVADTGDIFQGGMECVITGWGYTLYGGYSDTLQQACVPLLTVETCQKAMTVQDNVNPITSQMICAGGAGPDTCNGDSGGPLVCKKNGAWTLVGVTSWGEEGCPTTKPSVYSRITVLRAWMDETMAAN